MAEGTCSVDGCTKAHRAKGLCATHYNQLRPNRYLKMTVLCAGCGALCEKYRQAVPYDLRYCSLDCRSRTLGLAAERRRNAPALWRKPERAIHQPTVRADAPRLFVAGCCPQCGDLFVSRQPAAKFCSSRCSKNWWHLAYNARRGLRVSRATRRLVYDRDRGICQLCFEPVDMTLGPTHPQGPTLDHIECQSWSLVPDHRPRNLRLAHRLCNSIRGDRVA